METETKTYQLTPEEAAAVDAIRAQKAAEEAKYSLAQHILDTAASYYRWLTENGRGSTFNTFCNEYDYMPFDQEMSHKPIYDVVARLIFTARESADKMVG